MRFLATPIYDKDQLQGVILVAHPIDIIQNHSTAYFWSWVFLFLILIIPIFWEDTFGKKLLDQSQPCLIN